MSSLIAVNKTLLQQNDLIRTHIKVAEKTGADISEVKKQISEFLQSQQTAFDALENARERPQVVPPGTGGTNTPSPLTEPIANEYMGLTGLQNFFNNVFAALVGGAMGPKILAGVAGFLGKGLKWGVIAYAADQILNLVFENFDVPPELAQEITGDSRRAIAGAAIARMLGLKGKWALLAGAVGYFYDEINAMIDGVTENSEIARSTVEWLDKYTGGMGQELIASVGSFAAGAAAMKGMGYAARGAGMLARVTGRGIVGAARAAPGIAATVARNAPAVLNPIKRGAQTVLGYGMRAISTAGVAGTAPIAATAGTLAVLGASTNEYKNLLEQYPELAPMNNGAGPGLVLGKYLVENGMIDEAIAEQKRKGTYKERIERDTTRTAPTLTAPQTGAVIPPEVSGGADAAAIMEYLNSTSRSPIVPGNNAVGNPIPQMAPMGTQPPVVVVPMPAPQQAPSAPQGRSSTALITPPVPTTDRLDSRDRIYRPY